MVQLRSGGLLAGRYRLTDQIGTGGMSVVWRAHDEVLDRMVAVKVLAAALAADDKFRHMVRGEARAAAQLVHPHVTAVYDYGETVADDGTVTAFVVMELVVGEQLGDRLMAGPLPWPAAVEVCAQVAAAVAAAHRLHIVHRDVTPANVMLTPTGAKVLDFGIATRIGAPDHDDYGDLFGTPAYLAPERLDGVPTQPAADTYALGVLIFESVTGRLPYPADTWEELIAALIGPVPALTGVPGLPPAVADVCRRCLARDPRARPTAHEVAAVLRASLSAAPAGEPVRVPTLPLGAGHLPAHRAPRRTALTAVLSAAALTAAVLFGLSLRPDEDRRPTALPPTAPARPEAVAAPTPTPRVTPRQEAAGSLRRSSSGSGSSSVATAPRPGTAGKASRRAGGGAAGDVAAGAAAVDRAVDDFSQLVNYGMGIGDVEPDAGRDLIQSTFNARRSLARGAASVGKLVDGLRDKVADRQREGAITPEFAGLLDDALDRVVAAG